ncbi:hypothetical protein D3C76_1562980 [compost metagenome]
MEFAVAQIPQHRLAAVPVEPGSAEEQHEQHPGEANAQVAVQPGEAAGMDAAGAGALGSDLDDVDFLVHGYGAHQASIRPEHYGPVAVFSTGSGCAIKTVSDGCQ